MKSHRAADRLFKGHSRIGNHRPSRDTLLAVPGGRYNFLRRRRSCRGCQKACAAYRRVARWDHHQLNINELTGALLQPAKALNLSNALRMVLIPLWTGYYVRRGDWRRLPYFISVSLRKRRGTQERSPPQRGCQQSDANRWIGLLL